MRRVSGLCAAIFVMLTALQASGYADRWDGPAATWFAAERAPEATHILRALTAIGEMSTLTWLTVAACAALFASGMLDSELARGAKDAGIFAGAMIALSALMFSLKAIFARPRPPRALALLEAPQTFSYPSGHATMTTFWCCLVILFLFLRASRRAALMGTVLLAPLAVLVAFSRPYLGVHWVSDILAGTALALAGGLLTADLICKRDVRRYEQKRPADHLA
ncbi:phosphatase PAP2 family protein [Dermabacteraceae bacterium TAE3-ERU27]|nr:phosphatase PAP2 family protein [Dermabacteraceae bacterium TAE3-ERU27]